jgi:hypothetical protein
MDTLGDSPADPKGAAGSSLDGSSDATADLKRTLSAVATGLATRQDLENAATNLVAHLRRERNAPEQMLLRIKEVLADAGLRPTYASTEQSSVGADGKLYRDVIAWCIRSYYEASPIKE